jgi:hypothetical protein
VLRALAACAGLILAGFHVWLLGQLTWTGRLETAASLRWLLAFGLVAGMFVLHRRGTSLWGRRAIALWVLAAVLHGPSFGAEPPPPAQLIADTSSIAIQIAGAALGVALALTSGRMAQPWRPAIDVAAAAFQLVPGPGLRRATFTQGFLPRPPPLP